MDICQSGLMFPTEGFSPFGNILIVIPLSNFSLTFEFGKSRSTRKKGRKLFVVINPPLAGKSALVLLRATVRL